MLKSTFIALSLSISPFAVAGPVTAQNAPAKTAAAPVDPVRLKLAEQTVAKLIPPGTYKKIMKDMMDTMAGGLVEQMMGVDAAVVAGMAGEEARSETAAAVDGKSIGDLAMEKDPQFKERMDITMKVMFAEIGDLMSEMEPVVRTAMSSIYARKYSARELADMNMFFGTPSGASFAANFMSSFTDKEMIDASFGMMPKMMEAMPAIIKKVEAATAHLPPLAKPDIVTGVEEVVDCTADGDDSDCPTPETAAAEAIAAAGQAALAGENRMEPWYMEENWSAAERKKVKALEGKHNALATKSEAAYFVFDEARSAVIDDARKRYLADGWKPAPAEEPITTD